MKGTMLSSSGWMQGWICMNAQTTDGLSILNKTCTWWIQTLTVLIRDGERPGFVVSSVSECLMARTDLKGEHILLP